MRATLVYILKFLGIFCLLYFVTLAVIGVAAPGGRMHFPFVAKYLDYVSWIKLSLIRTTAFILGLFGVATYERPGFVLQHEGGRSIMVAYSCVGYGVYSFWVAFVVANKGKVWKKIRWAVGGVLALWGINVIRVVLFLTAINKGWPMPFDIDHHTWFNIFAYLLIFILIILYDRSFKDKKEKGNMDIALSQQQIS